MPSTFARRVIAFNKKLRYTGSLPQGFDVINPFEASAETMQVMQQFYQRFYNDNLTRRFIIGINPGRHGAAVTGVPFTDTKRLQSACGISMHTAYSHEPSSVFVYNMIDAYGGVSSFYQNFYINSPFPLAIVRRSHTGKWLNANYYDDPQLFGHVKKFMLQSLKQHLSMGLYSNEVFVLGKKNAQFIQTLNDEAGLFQKITILEHPRYIAQYKSKEKQAYIDKYLQAFENNGF